ncbi:MAG: hypothetical protein ACK5DC_04120 [Burkholderiales bacterium]|jgi:hypothetical protein
MATILPNRTDTKLNKIFHVLLQGDAPYDCAPDSARCDICLGDLMAMSQDLEIQTLARKIDIFISAIVLMAIEQSLKDGHHPTFRVGPGLFLKKDIEEKFKFQFYEAKSLLFEFWDIRGIFSNALFIEAHHPLRFHFVKAEQPMGRLFVLKDLHDLGDCHAYFLDRSNRMRPLSFRESPNAPTKDELEIMLHALEKHALELSPLKAQGIHHEN